MDVLLIAVVVLILGMGVVLFQMLHMPAGIKGEHHIEQHKIFSRTSAVVHASPDEAFRLLHNDWSWWNRGRAGTMTDLGDGRKQFDFHPIRFFNLIEVPPAFIVRFERVETLPDGGKRIHATLTGDFDGPAQYTARPGPEGTMVELAWCGAEVRGVLKSAPIALVTAIHCWRERLGVQGLRKRLESASLRPESSARTT